MGKNYTVIVKLDNLDRERLEKSVESQRLNKTALITNLIRLAYSWDAKEWNFLKFIAQSEGIRLEEGKCRKNKPLAIL